MEHIKSESNVYLYFVLPQHLCRVKLDIESETHKEPRKPPPTETLLYFPDRDLPVGMGAFTFGSQVYLLGGEILEEGGRLSPYFPAPSDVRPLSDRVFLFDHLCPPNIFQVSTMNCPKPCPQIAIVGDKIYAFAGVQYCGNKAPPKIPMFEYYDLTREIWNVLPDPPMYIKNEPTWSLYVSVVGRKIIARYLSKVYTYDVDTDNWTCPSSDWIYWRIPREVENHPFNFPGRVADKSDEGIVVIYTSRGVVAYLDENLVRCQVLDEINRDLPSPDEGVQVAFISYLGDCRFCLFLSDTYEGVKGEWLMHVVLFRLRMLEEENEGEDGKDFCRVSVFSHHRYNVSSDITKGRFQPSHAFIVREGFEVAEGKVGFHRVSVVDRGNDRTPQDPIKTSKSAKRNEKEERGVLVLDNGSKIEASSSAIASQIEGLNISSNPLTVTSSRLSSIDHKIEELRRELRRKVRDLTPRVDAIQLEKLKRLLLQKHGMAI